MKYGIIVDGRVTEPVTVPPTRESDPLVWLGVQFPGYSGWVPVSDDAVPGATYNGPGSSTNPSTVVAEPKSWDAFDFKMRFTSDERKAILAAAKTNADVEDFDDMLNTAAATGTRIVSTNALVRDGLTLMENAGLIDPGRAAEILGE